MSEPTKEQIEKARKLAQTIFDFHDTGEASLHVETGWIAAALAAETAPLHEKIASLEKQFAGMARLMEVARLEEAAQLAETWGHAPPNPHGRRAALASAIRALAGSPAQRAHNSIRDTAIEKPEQGQRGKKGDES